MDELERRRILSTFSEKISAILDTDPGNEMDDQFAIAWMAVAKKRINLLGLTAAPFLNSLSSSPLDGMEKSYRELLRWRAILSRPDVPVLPGARAFLKHRGDVQDTPAARFIIEQAGKCAGAGERLYLVAIGALTNIASALALDPTLPQKAVLVWLGGNSRDFWKNDEFNLVEDVSAAQMVFASGIPLVRIPTVDGAVSLTLYLEELRLQMPRSGVVGWELLQLARRFMNEDTRRIIWDISAPAFFLTPEAFESAFVPTPQVDDCGQWLQDAPLPHCCLEVRSINRKQVFAAFWDNLAEFALEHPAPARSWDTFDALRPHLMEQYLHPVINPNSGLPQEELRQRFEAMVEANRHLPMMELRAQLMELLLREAPVGVDPDNWFAHHIACGDLLVQLQGRLRAECAQSMPEIQQRCDANRASGISFSQLDLSHTSPDWRRIVTLGIPGILQEAQQRLNSAVEPEKLQFYRGVVRVYSGVVEFIRRLAAEAQRLDAWRCVGALERLAVAAPSSFQEALQLMLIYHHLQEMEGELVRSMGCFDRVCNALLEQDLQTGRLTRQQAKELLKFFWIDFYAQSQGRLWGKNFTLGGMDGKGESAENTLTQLALECYDELNVVDPKLTLRVDPEGDLSTLKQACRMVKKGRSAVVFVNDRVAKKCMLAAGKSAADMDDFIMIGCYEPSIMGKELCCSMSTLFNLAKVLELTMAQFQTPPEDFQHFFNAYLSLLEEKLRESMELTCQWESRWPLVNPSPLLSGTMEPCMMNGRDVSQAGNRYNPSGVVCTGLGTAVDGLMAVRELLFQQQALAWTRFQQILADNWQGAEEVRLQAQRRVPKWGNNHPIADELAVNIARKASEIINATPNAKGGFYQAGMWSINWDDFFGQVTGATPDGRLAGERLSKNLCATLTMDKSGVGALIHSVSKLPHEVFPNGTILDVTLHPTMVSGGDGAAVLQSLIMAYFRAGGLAVQFNILDANTLRSAQENPELYPNVQIRVCGWNVRFIDLPPEAQEVFIQEASWRG